MNSPAGGGLPSSPLPPASRPHKEKGRREKNGKVAMAGGGASKNNEEQEEEEGGGVLVLRGRSLCLKVWDRQKREKTKRDRSNPGGHVGTEKSPNEPSKRDNIRWFNQTPPASSSSLVPPGPAPRLASCTSKPGLKGQSPDVEPGQRGTSVSPFR